MSFRKALAFCWVWIKLYELYECIGCLGLISGTWKRQKKPKLKLKSCYVEETRIRTLEDRADWLEFVGKNNRKESTKQRKSSPNLNKVPFSVFGWTLICVCTGLNSTGLCKEQLLESSKWKNFHSSHIAGRHLSFYEPEQREHTENWWPSVDPRQYPIIAEYIFLSSAHGNTLSWYAGL